jgi:HK97 family phage prohead protease
MTTAPTEPQTLTQHIDFTITLAAAGTGDADGAGGDHTFTALGIPYGEELKRTDWSTGATRQKWAEGSVTVAENNQVFYGHDWQNLGLPIGRIPTVEQTAAGPKITAQLSRTPKADEVHTLMKDGVLTKVSAGLITTAWHLEDDGDLLVHDASEAFEFSVVPQPAFNTAAISSVNSATHPKENPMTAAPTIDLATLAKAEDVTTLAESVTALERKIDTLPSTLAGATGPTKVPFRRYGEFLKAFAAGDEEALNLARFMRLALREQDASTLAELTTLAYTGGTTGDLDGWLKDSWIGDMFNLAMSPVNRKLTAFFGTSAVPATGMNVEYGIVSSDTTQVGEQANQGDTLVAGKIVFDTDTAPITTIGGMGEMSRQQVERSAMNVVEKFFRAVLRKYAQRAEANVKTTVVGATPHTLAGDGTHDLATAAGWRAYFIDAAIYLEDTYGLSPEGVLMGYDMFKQLAGIAEASANDMFLDRENGSLNVKGLTGDLYTVPIVPFSTGATTGFVRVAHSEAIGILETANPTQLTDSDITNLTNAYSVYGYQAIAEEETDLLVAPDETA